jgi:predicted transcriptional regulator
MKELTKAESEIMYILWEKRHAFVQEIIDEMPAPKPAYNTVSTIVRILEQKGVVGHEAYGRSHRYFPLIDKKEYTRGFMKNVVSRHFENSVPQMVSFFTQQENLSVRELEEIKQLMEKKLREKKTPSKVGNAKKKVNCK